MIRSEIDWTFANQYRPKLCGDCKYFDNENAHREQDHGWMISECVKLHRLVARTDWCTKKSERREHIRAMLMYRGQNERDT